MVKLEISVALSGVGGSDMEILVQLISAVEKMGLDGGNLVRLPWQSIYLFNCPSILSEADPVP